MLAKQTVFVLGANYNCSANIARTWQIREHESRAIFSVAVKNYMSRYVYVCT
jgi:hypothetical protein